MMYLLFYIFSFLFFFNFSSIYCSSSWFDPVSDLLSSALKSSKKRKKKILQSNGDFNKNSNVDECKLDEDKKKDYFTSSNVDELLDYIGIKKDSKKKEGNVIQLNKDFDKKSNVSNSLKDKIISIKGDSDNLQIKSKNKLIDVVNRNLALVPRLILNYYNEHYGSRPKYYDIGIKLVKSGDIKVQLYFLSEIISHIDKSNSDFSVFNQTLANQVFCLENQLETFKSGNDYNKQIKEKYSRLDLINKELTSKNVLLFEDNEKLKNKCSKSDFLINHVISKNVALHEENLNLLESTTDLSIDIIDLDCANSKLRDEISKVNKLFTFGLYCSFYFLLHTYFPLICS